MPSLSISEPRLRRATLRTSTADRLPAQRDLLVLWQHPETRSFSVVGRLQFDGADYAFHYTRSAELVSGFRTLPGLRDLHTRYRSHTLFPVFAQRVMSSTRPNSEAYLSQLGLSPESATPWEQIVRSGGYHYGDTLQLLAVPTISNDHAQAVFLTHGMRHISRPGNALHFDGKDLTVAADEQSRALNGLQSGSPLSLIPENRNPKNRDALLIASKEGIPLGYVPDVLVESLHRINQPQLTVKRINGPDAPWHLRLVVKLDTPVASSFSFDPNGMWERIGDGS